jgi:DNA-binding beta-propeller fold protein YncE
MHKLGSTLAALLCTMVALLASAPCAQADTLVPVVTTLAGAASTSGSADGLGPMARFSDPSGVALSADGALALVADTQNHTIRKLVVATGAVTTLAGSPRANGSANGVGAAARLFHPEGLTLSSDGTLALAADTDNHTLRVIVVATGEVTTLAGSPGSPGSANGLGAVARFSSPAGVALSAGFALVADTGNHAIRRVDLATGAVTTLAGSAGSPGSADGAGSAARLRYPRAVALSADGGTALVADFSNNLIRTVVMATGAVTTLAGSPGSSGSADGVGTGARFAYPAGIALSGDATFALVADPDNQTIRRLSFVSLAPQVALPVLQR